MYIPQCEYFSEGQIEVTEENFAAVQEARAFSLAIKKLARAAKRFERQMYNEEE